MIFTPTSLPGAWLIDIAPNHDERGFFARTVCSEEFRQHGLNSDFLQQSIAWNPRRGTLRGLHYQAAPYGEDKLVRVTRGAVFDVILDLRRDSPQFGKWFSVELSAANRRQLYIPKGVAHGYQTLEDNTEIFYQMTTAYVAESARGILWDDLQLAIPWPSCPARTISERDLILPRFAELS